MQVASLHKIALKRKGVTYVKLVERISAIGISEKERNVAIRLSREKFSAAFVLQCQTTIETEHLHLA
jgi:hypothetical protein